MSPLPALSHLILITTKRGTKYCPYFIKEDIHDTKFDDQSGMLLQNREGAHSYAVLLEEQSSLTPEPRC